MILSPRTQRLKKLAEKSPGWACIHPWSHLCINPNGSTKLCCHHTNSDIGDTNTESIEDIMNGPTMRRIRRQMLAGQSPNECEKCDRIERIPAGSPRMKEHGRSYAEEIRDKYIATTQPDGTAEYSLKYWDLRFSNICNMSCVMCNSDWSSLWSSESQAITKGFTQEHIDKDSNLTYMQWQHKLTTAKVNQTKDFQWIDNHMDQVERIYFAGGEPMIMPSHWYILEKLHARKRFDVELSYNTNMLKLSHGGKRALDYWQDWPHKQVKVQPSIDETGERAEWIRYGTVWDTVKQNIISVRDAGIWMEPMLSVGAYNILRLPQLLKELYELFNNKIQINIVWNKEWRLSNLNWEDRQSVKPQLEQLHDLVSDPGVMNQLYHLLDSEEITSSKLLDRCALLDLHRGKNSMQIIPGFQAVNKRLGNRYEYARERYLNKQPVEKMKI